MPRKVLVLILFAALTFVPNVFAGCERCGGQWPNLRCKDVGEGQNGFETCEEFFGGGCEMSGNPCDASGTCDEGESECEIDNQSIFHLPVIAPGETRVIDSPPMCRGGGLIIEA